MAEADRRRLLERALALPRANREDFFGGRLPPGDADPSLLRTIDDTSLRTKLVEVGLAEGLQSPKGPQRIASIVRIYPDFDGPRKTKKTANGRADDGRRRGAIAASPAARGALPSVEEMTRLLERVRETEADVERDVAAHASERIAALKRTIADLDGDDLERALAELGEALERKRAQRSQTRFEAFERIAADTSFPERVYLCNLRR